MRSTISIAGPGREGMGRRPGGCLRESRRSRFAEKPAVLVEGNTNTVLAGALVPSKYVPLADTLRVVSHLAMDLRGIGG